MSMHSRLIEQMRRARGWLIPTALLTLAPKCILCMLAYAGLGGALGLGGPEICGASEGSPASWASSHAWLGIASGISTFGFVLHCRRGAPPTHRNRTAFRPEQESASRRRAADFLLRHVGG